MENPIDRQKRLTMHLLSIFDALPLPLIQEWLLKIDKEQVDIKSFNTWSYTGHIYTNREKNYCYMYHGMNENYTNDCIAYMCLQLLSPGEHRISRACYPFDYIIEHDHKTYQIINFEQEGKFKLRFRKNMDEQHTTPEDIIPMIVLINNSIDALKEKDSQGRYSLIPAQDYVIAEISYNPYKEYRQAYSCRFTKHKGGTI